jgi:hypothetical protein
MTLTMGERLVAFQFMSAVRMAHKGAASMRPYGGAKKGAANMCPYDEAKRAQQACSPTAD